ncbi:MAG: 4'-phosphopantetheinyl transferase superfamily protein [Desulfomonilaceae bacterium]
MPSQGADEHEPPLTLEFSNRYPGILCACFRLHFTGRDRKRRNWAKQAAVSSLWASIAEMLDEVPNPNVADLPSIEIASDKLGKPHLLIDGSELPAVSFAYEGDTLWVAVCRTGFSIGIDAENAASFRGDYPFQRVFQEGELEIRDKREDAAAMIWSAKEAVVKALGCGFHLIDPLHLRVESCSECHEKTVLKAYLTDGIMEGSLVSAEHPAYVRIFRHGGTWVSVALVARDQAC